MYIEYYGSLCYILVHEDARASSDFNFDAGNILTPYLAIHQYKVYMYQSSFGVSILLML